jgi:hypothetical protein
MSKLAGRIYIATVFASTRREKFFAKALEPKQHHASRLDELLILPPASGHHIVIVLLARDARVLPLLPQRNALPSAHKRHLCP